MEIYFSQYIAQKLLNTLLPQYNALRYNAFSDTTLFFLGSEIIFKKYLWGWVEVNSPIFPHIRMSNYLIYISMAATKIFSLEEKTDMTSLQETKVSSRLLKIHAYVG